MADDSDVLGFDKNPHLVNLFEQTRKGKPEKPKDSVEPADSEASCPAFGFLRGLSARALALQFKFADGNNEWHAYSLLASWRLNPSVGMLLKFTSGDVVTLVLIRGSNLDAELKQHAVNLTDRGLQRHRITSIREMDQDELRRAKPGEPTIDRIEVAECETVEEQREWLAKAAPVFVRAAGK